MSTKTEKIITRLTGGKRGFCRAVDEGFASQVCDPTIRYSHPRGFHTESRHVPADDDVIWEERVCYDLNNGSRRNLRPVDYSEIRESIIRFSEA